VAVPPCSGRGDPGAAFLTADLPGGTRAHVLAVTGHATRRIRILGVTLYPSGERTARQARNLLTDLGGQAGRMNFMIRDRGSDFTGIFDAVLPEDTLASVAWSTNIAWPHDLDEVFGTHTQPDDNVQGRHGHHHGRDARNAEVRAVTSLDARLFATRRVTLPSGW
jgi:hypothetical protein